MVCKERVIYPDGTRKTERFAKHHKIGDHFFDVSNMSCIICWQIVEIIKTKKSQRVKVQRHPNEKELVEKSFALYRPG